MRPSPTLMQCPACPAQLQPLPPRSNYVAQAVRYATDLGVDIPAHGPVVLTWAALVSHARVCHDQLDLIEYLEAYLSS